jgi:hypothetical protein
MNRHCLVALILCGVALAACRTDSPQLGQQPTVTETDGVLHVVMPSLGNIASSEWRIEQSWSTLDAGSPVDLHQVVDAVFTADGTLAVANTGTREILMLGREGGLDLRIGRQGEGPGEFNAISKIDADAAGNVMAYDPRQARITTFGPAGQVRETHRLAPPNRVVDLMPLAFLDDGGVIAIYGEIRMFASGGVRRDTTPLFRFDASGATADTLGLLPATEWAYVSIPEGSSRRAVGFGRTLATAGRRGRSVVGGTDSLDITVFGATGTVAMRITGGGPPVEATGQDIERWRQSLRDRMSQAPEPIRRAFDDTPYRPTFPAFEALMVDDAARIWIGAYVRPGETDRRWTVLGTDGSVAGTLALPAAATLLDAAGDRLAVLLHSDLDEEYIVVYRIDRS